MCAESADLLLAVRTLKSILRGRPREKERLASLLGVRDHVDDVATALAKTHLPLRLAVTPPRAALELHWRCAVELAALNEAALRRLDASLGGGGGGDHLVDVMRRVLPVFSQLKVYDATPSSSSSSSSSRQEEQPSSSSSTGTSLAASYEKWAKFDDDEENNDLEALWCARHGLEHQGECPKCAKLPPAAEPGMSATEAIEKAAQVKTIPDREELVSRCREIERCLDPSDPSLPSLRRTRQGLERRVADDRRRVDVVRQLQDRIETMPDDEVDFDACLRAMRIAEAHMPPDYAGALRISDRIITK